MTTTKDEFEVGCPCGCIAIWGLNDKGGIGPHEPGYDFKRVGRLCLEHYKKFLQKRNDANFKFRTWFTENIMLERAY